MILRGSVSVFRICLAYALALDKHGTRKTVVVKALPSEYSGTFGFSYSAFKQGTSESLPQISADNTGTGFEVNSSFTNSIAPAGFVSKPCGIGYKQNKNPPYDCVLETQTTCTDGRIAGSNGDCTIQCTNPDDFTQISREFCTCV